MDYRTGGEASYKNNEGGEEKKERNIHIKKGGKSIRKGGKSE